MILQATAAFPCKCSRQGLTTRVKSVKGFLSHLIRYSSLGYTEEEKAEVAKQLLSLSQACSQSLEELTSLGVEEEDINVEEEDEGVNELSTISEEQGEL